MNEQDRTDTGRDAADARDPSPEAFDIDRTIQPRTTHESGSGNDAPFASDRTMPNIHVRRELGGLNVGDVVLGRYELLKKLGAGAMGVVYKCRDQVSQVEYALKMVPPELSRDAEAMEDVLENFQLIHGLKHSNIASVDFLDRDEFGSYFLVMDYVQGSTLSQWIKRKWRSGQPETNEIVSIVRQIASVLDYAHKKRILHRDIKPANVMLDENGEVKVLDFGLASKVRNSLTSMSVNPANSGGTPGYLAPEQFKGRYPTPAADQYALAVMAYQMLSGHLPFDSDDYNVLRSAVVNEAPEPVEGIPPAANECLLKALSKDPKMRFANCTEFADELERALNGSVDGRNDVRTPPAVTPAVTPPVATPIPVPPTPPPPAQSAHSEPVRPERRGRGAWFAVMAVLLLLGCIGYGIYQFRQIEQTDTDRAEEETTSRKHVSKRTTPLPDDTAQETAETVTDAIAQEPAETVTDATKEAGAIAQETAENAVENVQEPAPAIKLETAENAVENVQEPETAEPLTDTIWESIPDIDLRAATDVPEFGMGFDPGHPRGGFGFAGDSPARGANAPQGGFGGMGGFGGPNATTPEGQPRARREAATQQQTQEQEPEQTAASPRETTSQTQEQKPEQTTTSPGSATPGKTIVSAGPPEQMIALADGVEMKLLKIEAGTFEMSAKDGENYPEEVPHQVTLTQDFYLARTEVTQAQWKAVMGTDPADHKGDNLPVEKVSWHDAMEFCMKLNETGKAPSGWMFTLPTETQWEYAARGGNKSKGYKFSGSDDLGEVAWCWDNSSSKTHPVGQKSPNELGLCDMSGNVYEWCLDDWNSDSSKLTAEFTRDDDQNKSNRALRGGRWGNLSRFCRSAYRGYGAPTLHDKNLGFRPALVPASL